MIVEIRTYTMHPGKAGAWLEYYEKNGLPIQQEMLGKLIFMGSTEIGTLNQVVHIWTYASLAEREQKRGAMAKDPRWHNYLKNQTAGLLLTQESMILTTRAYFACIMWRSTYCNIPPWRKYSISSSVSMRQSSGMVSDLPSARAIWQVSSTRGLRPAAIPEM